MRTVLRFGSELSFEVDSALIAFNAASALLFRRWPLVRHETVK
jgi:hypothetical protein